MNARVVQPATGSPKGWLRSALARFVGACGAESALVADLDAPYVGPDSVAGQGISEEPWLEAVRQARTVSEVIPPAGRPRVVFFEGRTDGGARTSISLHGDQSRWRTLAVAIGRSHPTPAERRAIGEALDRPWHPVHSSISLLDAVGRHTGLPFALFERRQLMWANAQLWRALELRDGVEIGLSFADPKALIAAARLEAAARGEIPLRGFVLTTLSGGQHLLQAANPEQSQRSSRVERLSKRWRLTPMERHELGHILLGRSSKEAAALDGVSPETTRERRRQIYRKAGVGGAGPLRAILDGYVE
ncbi:MAG TPA: hypothetical protein VN033_07265 [Vulgatibacter sp.]|nr:hypothetical protein [Vulgatibacter sp.]